MGLNSVLVALPALHPVYSIPSEPNGSNHTPQFAKSAATTEAHDATLRVAAGLAATGFRVLQDPDFADRVSHIGLELVAMILKHGLERLAGKEDLRRNEGNAGSLAFQHIYNRCRRDARPTASSTSPDSTAQSF